MKLSWAAIALFFGALLASCGGGAPDIDIAELVSDLGQVENGEIRNFEVPIENLGRSDLVIEAVTTSCGCTTASVSPEVIPAGETGLLKVSYDSGAHGPNEVGSIMRQIFITTNDPDEVEFEYRFVAEVTPGDQ